MWSGEAGGDAWEIGFGVALTLLSQAILAGRLVAEECLLTSSSLHPMQAGAQHS